MRYFLIERVADEDNNTEKKLVIADSPEEAWSMVRTLSIPDWRYMPDYAGRGGDFLIQELKPLTKTDLFYQ